MHLVMLTPNQTQVPDPSHSVLLQASKGFVQQMLS